MLHLRLLGSAILENEQGALEGTATHRQPLAMLALLACAPARTLSRGKLVGMLWPDSPEKTARGRLSTYVHRLRGELGPETLISAGSDLRLNDDVVSSDVHRFRSAMEADDAAAAVAVYRGPFMDGFWLRNSPEFERWRELEQDRLRRAYHQALETLAGGAQAAGKHAEAARWWRERSADDPFDSRVTARLMEALAASGNPAAALRVAREHARALEEELGASPSVEVTRLSAELRADEAEPSSGSIAVLPFEELSTGEPTASFASGLHNDLLTRLSRVNGLKVISRTSVLRYRGGEATIPEIAEELGVRSVVEGGVQHAGGRMRLNVQLIDVRSDVHLWAETYDRTLTAANLFEIQSELATRIAESLRWKLTPDERNRIMAWAPTRDLDAYRLHAQGRAQLDLRTEGGMRRALEHFENALEHDDRYALAWAGKADALTLLHEYGYEPAGSTLSHASRAAARAAEIDPDLAEAHGSLGLLAEARHQGPAAIREHRHAVELQPGYAEAHNWLSWTSQLLGRPAEALKSAKRAVELNPLSPEAVSNLSVSHLINGEAEAALAEARRGRELQPSWDTPIFYEALALFDLERFAEAGELLRDVPVFWAGPGAKATRALAFAAVGERKRAQILQSELAGESEICAVAVIHASLGELDTAFEALERVESWTYWPTLAMHHYYRGVLGPLRADPRFPAVVERVNRAWGLEADGSMPA